MNADALLARLFAVLFACILCAPPAIQATINNPKTIHIGVLVAEEGKDLCFKKWRATAEYLQQRNPQYSANIVCLDYHEIEKAVSDGLVDFTITNPAVYVSLEYIFGASRIATLEEFGSQAASTQFGSVLFTTSGHGDIKTVADLRGKRVAAVDRSSFGGWLMFLRHIKASGLDPFKDFATVNFAGSHRGVVFNVLNGKADAGIVRTGILEQMASEGIIDATAYRIVDGQPADDVFPYARTTELYPHWALAKMHHVSTDLAEQVMRTFLDISPENEAARAARIQGWTIPLDYYEVHLCLQELKAGPYRYLNASTPLPLTIGQFYRQYRPWVLAGTGLFMVVLSATIVVLLLNRKLTATTLKLNAEHREKEKTLADLNDFKTTLDKTHDAVFILDPDSILFVYVNEGGVKLLGYSLEELMTMTPLDITSDYNESSLKELFMPLRNGTQEALTLRTRFIRKDGSSSPVEIFLQLVTPEGKKSRFVAIVHDITRRVAERKEREQLLTRLNSEQKLSSIGQLAAGIAHEINTPVQYLGSNIEFLGEAFGKIDALIGGYGHLLVEAADTSPNREAIVTSRNALKHQVDWDYLTEEVPNAISQSREGIAKISSIVHAMKEFSHPGCKEKQVTDLNKLIETTITVSSNEWKYVAEIDKQLDATLPPVLCLPNEMGQVLLNILVNAAHAIKDAQGTSQEGIKGKITIGSRQAGDHVEITVTDTGGGIPEAIATKIFDPFFTTKEVGRGTGQGLAISRDIIVNKHRGTIDFVSTEGEGTTFIIRLPLDQRPNAQSNLKGVTP